MGPPEIVRGLTIIAFASVAFVAYRQRRGGTANRWIFLSFALLAVINVVLALLDDDSSTPAVAAIRRTALAALPLFPYFLFRFTASLTPPRRWLEWAATGSTVLVAVASVVASGSGVFNERPAWHSMTLLSHWIFLSVATSLRLWRVGRTEPTVARRRIRTFSIGTLTLTLTLVLALATKDNAVTDTVVRLVALSGALLFLFALAPPPPIRAMWRRPEEDRLHRAIADLMSATNTPQITGVLLPFVAQLLGARGAALVSGGQIVASYGETAGATGSRSGGTELVRLSAGCLVVYVSPYTPLFGQEEFELVRSLADLAEVALERSKEHHIAETLQRSLLPRDLPRIPGIRVEARYLPGEEGAVGGDWYDVIRLPGNRVGLAIGDVMGHGLDAATRMGHLRSGLRAYAMDGEAPAAVLTRLDRLMHHLGMGGIATVLYLVLDLDKGTITYSSAGHPPAAIRDRASSVGFLEGALGPPLGVWDEPATEVSAPFGPGDVLVLYTDGLIERRGREISEGLTVLRQVMETAPRDGGGLCDRLLTRLLPEGSSDDDVALLLVQHEDETQAAAPLPQEACVTLDATLDSAGRARQFVFDTLAERDRTDDEGTVALLTSEVVANAVVHAVSPVVLTVRISPGAVRVAVADDDAVLPVLRHGDWYEESGRGLLLIDTLATAWGVEPSGVGKQVWFELALPAGTAPDVPAESLGRR